MSFLAFIQENLLLFALTGGVLGALVALEVRSFKTRGADLTTTALTQNVNSGALLIDLRSKDEFRAEHIVRAKNIPFTELNNHLQELGDKDNNVVFYCNTGLSSSKAIAKLRKDDYTNVKHLKGGLAAWRDEGLPVVSKG